MNMEMSNIPLKPKVEGMSNRVEEAQRVFFFERNDGKVIAVNEQEAWGLYTRRPQMLYKKGKRVEFELIGTGDGTIFQKAVQEAQAIGRMDIDKAKELIRKGQDEELEACRGKIIPPRNMDKMENAY